MRRLRLPRLLPLLLVLCAACEACGGAHEPAALPTNLVGATEDAQSRFATGSNRFAFDLFRGRPAGNQVFSPGSISLALAMTWAGARGETATQLARPFGFDEHTHAGAAGLIHAYNQSGSPLAVANRLYGDQGYDLRAEFLRLAETRYAAPFQRVDFRGDFEGVRAEINGWVEDRTHDRIRDLLGPGSLNDATRLVLVNAAYFLGTWSQPFVREATRPEAFHASATSQFHVPMMNTRLDARSATVGGARVLELPYEGGRFAMVFVLPEARHGLEPLERGLDHATWERWMAGLHMGEAIVAVPRFEVKLEPSLSLVGALQQLGVTHAFDDQLADFTGMAEPRPDRGPLVVGNILHQAFLRVDESGTEAAAATAVVVAETAAPAPNPIFFFRADEPFLFALRDVHTGLILFMGRVTDPR